MLSESKELARVLDESKAIADRLNMPFTSAHPLLCFYLVETQAAQFLQERGLTVDALLEAIQNVPDESPEIWDRILRRAEDVALVQKSRQIESLHLLVAICSFVESAAYQLVRSLGFQLGEIRSSIMAQLQGDQLRTVSSAARAPQPPPAPRSPSGPAAPLPTPRPVTFSSGTAKDLGERLFEKTEKQKAERTVSGKLNPISAIVSPDVLPPSAIRLRERRATGQQQVIGAQAPRAATVITARTEPASHPRPKPLPAFNPSRYALSKSEFPLLTRVGVNLSQAAIEGKIEAAIGRDDLIIRLVDTLNKRRSNNPLLVGEPGVGKTAIVEGFAHYLIRQAQAGIRTGLEDRVIVSVETSSMLAGTSLRGAFSERMNQLKQEVGRANGRVIIFFDELHHWIGAGGSNDGGADAAGDLKTALARGEFPCIGATTWAEYAKYIEPDSAFTRRFETLRVDEPDLESTIKIVLGVRDNYAEHHGVDIPDESIEHAVKLAHRYLPSRRNPDKSVGVIDFAGSLARRNDVGRVTLETVARAVADQAGIDPDRLLMNDKERYAKLPALLAEHIVGQQDAVARASSILQRNYAGFSSGRPIGSFLFLGPTGVGKTEFARALARVLFHDEDAMLRIDMSEYMEAHSIARLIGAPPGYVGHEAAGMLTEPIRRSPYQLVLLDELEKAHPEVLNLLIQVLDEGRLTDSRGNTVDFTNTIVVMTTNLGAESLAEGRRARPVGFADVRDDDHRHDEALREARKFFRPEVWNRIDEVIVFPPLTKEQVTSIAHKMLQTSSDRVQNETDIAFTCDDSVVDYLVANGGYDPSLGARPMRRAVGKLVEQAIAEEILQGRVRRGDRLALSVCDGALRIERALSDEDELKLELGEALDA